MRFNPDEYVPVNERVEKFHAKYPNGKIITAIVEHSAETGFVLMRAEAYREGDDAVPAATGHAYEYKSSGGPQASSYVEVCETSAVGRALALLGFEVKRGISSREEMQKAERHQRPAPASQAAAAKAAPTDGPSPVSKKRTKLLNRIQELWKEEQELGGKTPATETANLLNGYTDEQLIYLGKQISERVNRLADQRAAAEERV